MERVILHCDLNNFYASVECQYNPELRDKPVAVCGRPEERRGIVLAKNQIAKKYGVLTGEPIWKAMQKCPGLIPVPPNFELYMRFSKEARDIYLRYTHLVEAFGIDECWLDVSGNRWISGPGEKIAYQIKDTIKEELGITASVGVSFNKIFAKLGSDMKKPDAVTVINEDDFRSKIWPLPVGDLLYVGSATRKKLNKASIMTIGELANASPVFLRRLLGKWGDTLWHFANGFDKSQVHDYEYEQVIKGIGNSMTLPRDLYTEADVCTTLYVLAESVARRLRNHGFKGKTIQVHIRGKDLVSIERQGQLRKATNISNEIAEKALVLFREEWDWSRPVRAIGVRATTLSVDEKYLQLSLFNENEKREKIERLEKTIDKIRDRFGHYSVQRAVLIKDRDLAANPVEDNVIHPVSFFR